MTDATLVITAALHARVHDPGSAGGTERLIPGCVRLLNQLPGRTKHLSCSRQSSNDTKLRHIVSTLHTRWCNDMRVMTRALLPDWLHKRNPSAANCNSFGLSATCEAESSGTHGHCWYQPSGTDRQAQPPDVTAEAPLLHITQLTLHRTEHTSIEANAQHLGQAAVSDHFRVQLAGAIRGRRLHTMPSGKIQTSWSHSPCLAFLLHRTTR